MFDAALEQLVIYVVLYSYCIGGVNNDAIRTKYVRSGKAHVSVFAFGLLFAMFKISRGAKLYEIAKQHITKFL